MKAGAPEQPACGARRRSSDPSLPSDRRRVRAASSQAGFACSLRAARVDDLPILRSLGQAPCPGSEFASGASLSAHGLVVLLYARRLDELNAPKGKPRLRTLFGNPAFFSMSVCRWVGFLMRGTPEPGAIIARLVQFAGCSHRASVWRYENPEREVSPSETRGTSGREAWPGRRPARAPPWPAGHRVSPSSNRRKAPAR